MNMIQLAGLFLVLFGVYVVIRAIAKTIISPNKAGLEPRASRAKGKTAPFFKRGICPKCCKNTLQKHFSFLKCQSCRFFFPASWLLALITPLPLVGCALLLARWFVEADQNIQSDAGAGVVQSLGFWVCLGLFAAMCKMTAYSAKLGKEVR